MSRFRVTSMNSIRSIPEDDEDTLIASGDHSKAPHDDGKSPKSYGALGKGECLATRCLFSNCATQLLSTARRVPAPSRAAQLRPATTIWRNQFARECMYYVAAIAISGECVSAR